MESKLVDAAATGDVNQLYNLIAEKPFLFKPAELTGGRNPLHIACEAGDHAHFVKEVLYHCPRFAEELNADGVSPLHIASGYGHLDTVKVLLKMGKDICLVKARDGKIPLHCAVIGGKIQVVKELLLACRGISSVSDEGETCFHFAVKYNQLEVLRYLINHVSSYHKSVIRYVMNKQDKQKNSILHLAAFRKQYEVLDLLLDAMNLQSYLYLNQLNILGHTPLDVLELEGGRDETLEKLKRAGAKHATKMSILGNIVRNRLQVISFLEAYNTLPNGTRDVMLVVIVLIVAATFQAVINPPGGVWQDTVLASSSTTTADDLSSKQVPHYAGMSILATVKPEMFNAFLIFNSLGFMSSTFLLWILTNSINTGGLFRMTLLFLMLTYILCTVASNPLWSVSVFTVLSASGASVIYVFVLHPN